MGAHTRRDDAHDEPGDPHLGRPKYLYPLEESTIGREHMGEDHDEPEITPVDLGEIWEDFRPLFYAVCVVVAMVIACAAAVRFFGET